MIPNRYSRIAGTGSFLPPNRVTNDALVAQLARDGIETSDQWIVAEIPLEIPPAGQPSSWLPRRDDGQATLTVTNGDFFDAIRFVVRPMDVFGDMKPYVLIDDIQVFEKE